MIKKHKPDNTRNGELKNAEPNKPVKFIGKKKTKIIKSKWKLQKNKVTIDIRFPYTRDKQKHEVFIIEELEDNQILVEFKDKERLILSKDCIVIE